MAISYSNDLNQIRSLTFQIHSTPWFKMLKHAFGVWEEDNEEDTRLWKPFRHFAALLAQASERKSWKSDVRLENICIKFIRLRLVNFIKTQVQVKGKCKHNKIRKKFEVCSYFFMIEHTTQLPKQEQKIGTEKFRVPNNILSEVKDIKKTN